MAEPCLQVNTQTVGVYANSTRRVVHEDLSGRLPFESVLQARGMLNRGRSSLGRNEIRFPSSGGRPMLVVAVLFIPVHHCRNPFPHE